MAADDGQLALSFTFDKDETRVKTDYSEWSISNTLPVFQRHDVRIRRFVTHNVEVISHKGVMTMSAFLNSKDATAYFDQVVAFLENVDRKRQETFYVRCVVIDAAGDFVEIIQEQDSFVHRIHRSWVPRESHNPGDSFLVLRSLFDYRGPMNVHPKVILGDNVVDGKVYPHKLVKREVYEDGKISELHHPNMEATPLVVVTGKTYSDECLDF